MARKHTEKTLKFNSKFQNSIFLLKESIKCDSLCSQRQVQEKDISKYSLTKYKLDNYLALASYENF